LRYNRTGCALLVVVNVPSGSATVLDVAVVFDGTATRWWEATAVSEAWRSAALGADWVVWKGAAVAAGAAGRVSRPAASTATPSARLDLRNGKDNLFNACPLCR
jgi:hypothetical protein